MTQPGVRSRPSPNEERRRVSSPPDRPRSSQGCRGSGWNAVPTVTPCCIFCWFDAEEHRRETREACFFHELPVPLPCRQKCNRYQSTAPHHPAKVARPDKLPTFRNTQQTDAAAARSFAINELAGGCHCCLVAWVPPTTRTALLAASASQKYKESPRCSLAKPSGMNVDCDSPTRTRKTPPDRVQLPQRNPLPSQTKKMPSFYEGTKHTHTHTRCHLQTKEAKANNRRLQLNPTYARHHTREDKIHEEISLLASRKDVPIVSARADGAGLGC